MTGAISNRWKQWIAVLLLATVVANVAIAWQQRARLATGYGDFAALYTSGLMLRYGQGALLYDRAAQWKLQQQFAAGVDIRDGPLPLVRPPFEAILFLALSYFSYPRALALWTVAQLLLLWLALRILPRPARMAPAYPRALEFVLCLGFFPLFLDLFAGQDAILLLFLLSAGLRRLQSEKTFSAGLLLALGLFKFHLVVPLVLILCLGRHARILGGFLSGAVAIAAASLAISGQRAMLAYPSYLLSLNRLSHSGFAWPHRMPNLRGLLSPVPALAWLAIPLGITIIAATICTLRTARRSDPGALPLVYSLAMIVAVVTSYYSYSYDLTLVAIPMVLLSGGFLNQSGLALASRRWIIAGLLLLLLTPLDWFLLTRLDRGYLMAIPAVILAIGIAHSIRDSARASAPALRPA